MNYPRWIWDLYAKLLIMIDMWIQLCIYVQLYSIVLKSSMHIHKWISHVPLSLVLGGCICWPQFWGLKWFFTTSMLDNWLCRNPPKKKMVHWMLSTEEKSLWTKQNIINDICQGEIYFLRGLWTYYVKANTIIIDTACVRSFLIIGVPVWSSWTCTKERECYFPQTTPPTVNHSRVRYWFYVCTLYGRLKPSVVWSYLWNCYTSYTSNKIHI